MEFRILGHLEVVDGEGTIPLPGAKTKALLARMLGRANWVISTDELVEGLWGDRPPATAANTLQTYVSQLRKALGAAAIQTRGPGYLLAVEPQQIDAVRFEGLLQDARSRLTNDPEQAVSVLSEALGLWRGPALADFTFEAFAAPEIARLEELRLVATEERIEAELALGRHDQLTAALRRLVEEHPVRERLWSQLMVALYRSGRQAEALRAYAELRRIMRDELGVEPSSSLRRLEEAMVLQDPQLEWVRAERVEAAPPVLSNLPVARSPFVGRESELRELVKTVERHGLVTVVGPPGVGKSRLAVEAARQVFDEYPDGVWLAELFAVNDQSRVPNVVAAAVGAGDDDVASSTAELTHRLQDQRALFVLDGCEHLLPSTAALADEILRACPDLGVLVTSREPLCIEGETVLRLAPMPTPPSDDMEPRDVVEFDSVRLFVELSGMADISALRGDQSAAVARICRQLDGLPLAIELAAARTRALSTVQLADRLNDPFRVLTTGSRSGPAHHRSLKAAVDWSYDWLPEAERVLFRRLSVFSRRFRLEDAEAVCADDEVIEDGVLDLLCSLVDRSLLLASDDLSDRSYHMPELLRSYAAERLSDGEDAVPDREREWSEDRGRLRPVGPVSR